MPALIKKDSAAFRKAYSEKPVLRRAALAAGYSQNTANMGLAGLPKKTQQWVINKHRKLDKFIELGQKLTAQDQENAMRGAIYSNIGDGKDKAIGSIKLGMQDKRVNMLTPDSMTGIIVIQRPAELPILDVAALPEHIDDAK